MVWLGDLRGQILGEFALAKHAARGTVRTSDERTPIRVGRRSERRDLREDPRIVVAASVQRMLDEEQAMAEAEASEESRKLGATMEALRVLQQYAKDGENVAETLDRIIHERSVLAGVAIDAWEHGRAALARVVRMKDGVMVAIVPPRRPTT